MKTYETITEEKFDDTGYGFSGFVRLERKNDGTRFRISSGGFRWRGNEGGYRNDPPQYMERAQGRKYLALLRHARVAIARGKSLVSPWEFAAYHVGIR